MLYITRSLWIDLQGMLELMIAEILLMYLHYIFYTNNLYIILINILVIISSQIVCLVSDNSVTPQLRYS